MKTLTNINSIKMKPNTIISNTEAKLKDIKQAYKEFIIDKKHPCVMANAVFSLNNFEMKLFKKFASKDTALKMLIAIKAYLANIDFESNKFKSFIAVFPETQINSEKEFEHLLWDQLQYIHDIDEQPWDPNVSCDPENASFSFSIAGHAFYVVGMHPKSSRLARRTPYTTLVFNLHSQFVKLRANKSYHKIRDKIRERDIDFQGSVNPVLKDFGESSEAVQYSGRQITEKWQCPFHSNS
ncbi:guanitoxin biosynthesis heme-dependent pre-guanitoxin N-hydroxylase GntA [Cyclobacterium sp. 1_MG-2023]|nr:guanitoxin biosynthesis heme-dependent pre-guanitoxin N-hydroxylase GntA [Cyclobacterium sp. 1_MG-2023]